MGATAGIRALIACLASLSFLCSCPSAKWIPDVYCESPVPSSDLASGTRDAPVCNGTSAVVRFQGRPALIVAGFDCTSTSLAVGRVRLYQLNSSGGVLVVEIDAGRPWSSFQSVSATALDEGSSSDALAVTGTVGKVGKVVVYLWDVEKGSFSPNEWVEPAPNYCVYGASWLPFVPSLGATPLFLWVWDARDTEAPAINYSFVLVRRGEDRPATWKVEVPRFVPFHVRLVGKLVSLAVLADPGSHPAEWRFALCPPFVMGFVVFGVRPGELPLSLAPLSNIIEYTACWLTWCDLDGDRVPEILCTASQTPAVAVLRADDHRMSNWTLVSEIWLRTYFNKTRPGMCVSATGRAKRDVVFCSTDGNPCQTFVNLEPSPSGIRLVRVSASFPSERSLNIDHWADLDGDGKEEFVGVGQDGRDEVDIPRGAIRLWKNVSCHVCECRLDEFSYFDPLGYGCLRQACVCKNGSSTVFRTGGCLIHDRSLAESFCKDTAGGPPKNKTWCSDRSMLYSCRGDTLISTECQVCGMLAPCGSCACLVSKGQRTCTDKCQCNQTSGAKPVGVGLCAPTFSNASVAEVGEFCDLWRKDGNSDISWGSEDAPTTSYFQCSDGKGGKLSCPAARGHLPPTPSGLLETCNRSSSPLSASSSPPRENRTSRWVNLLLAGAAAVFVGTLGVTVFFVVRHLNVVRKREHPEYQTLANSPTPEGYGSLMVVDGASCSEPRSVVVEPAVLTFGSEETLLEPGLEYSQVCTLHWGEGGVGTPHFEVILPRHVAAERFDVRVTVVDNVVSLRVVCQCAALLEAEVELVPLSPLGSLLKSAKVSLMAQSALLPVSSEFLSDIVRQRALAVFPIPYVLPSPCLSVNAISIPQELQPSSSFDECSACYDVDDDQEAPSSPFPEAASSSSTKSSYSQLGPSPVRRELSPRNQRPEIPPTDHAVPSSVGEDFVWINRLHDLLSLPETTLEEVMEKETGLLALELEFEKVTMRTVATIVAEVSVPDDGKTIRPDVRLGGVAGGTKFVTGDGIFVKFARDAHGIYGGDEFAAKSCVHELSGSNAILSHYVSRNGNERAMLEVPLSVVLDFAGFRVVATSRLPISGDTLVYGSCDAGVTVKNCDPVVRDLFSSLAKGLCLKPHVAGTREKVEMCGPCDVEVHATRDDRYFVVDTARLFPPEAVSQNFNASILLPLPQDKERAGPSKTALGAAISSMPEDVSLPRQNWNEHALRICQSERLLCARFGGGLLCFPPSCYGGEAPLKPNRLASVLVSRPVFGTAILIPPGIKGRHLHTLLRPEFVLWNAVPLSSDAFTKFGHEDAEVHNDEVRKATKRLRTEVITSFVAHLRAHAALFITGADLVQEMHRRGINMRFLSVVFRLLVATDERERRQLSRLTNLILAEIVIRSVKAVVKEAMRSVLHRGPVVRGDRLEAAERLAIEVVVEHLNFLLWLDPASEVYWRGIVKTRLQTKYGQYVSMRTREHWSEIESRGATLATRYFLLRGLQEHLGVELRSGVDVFEHLSATRCFTAADVAKLHVIVQGRLDLFSHFDSAAPSRSWQSWLHLLERRAAVVSRTCGVASRENSVCLLQISVVLCKLGCKSEVRTHLQEVMAAWPEVHATLAAIAMFELSRLMREGEEQEKVELLSKAQLLLSYDTKQDEEFVVGHPFELLVLNELVSVLWRRREQSLARTLSLRFHSIVNCFGICLPAESWVRLFGSSTPLAYSLCSSLCLASPGLNDGVVLKGETGPAEDPQVLLRFEERVMLQDHLSALLSSKEVVGFVPRTYVPRTSLERRPYENSATAPLAVPTGSAVHVTWMVREGREPQLLHQLTDVRVVSLTAGLVTDTGQCSFFAVSSDKRMFVWGDNTAGQLGLGAGADVSVGAPVVCESLGNTAQKVASGGRWTLILTVAGDVLSCGDNSGGSLGTGDTERRLLPMPIQPLEGEGCVDVAAAPQAGFAVSRSGVLHTWGRIGRGRASLLPTALGGEYASHRVSSVSLSDAMLSALCNDGTVVLWSALPDLPEAHAASFPNDSVTQILCVKESVISLTSSGRCYCWGDNTYGTLATGDFRSHDEPTVSEMISSARPLRLLSACGFESTCVAITSSGEAVWWGARCTVPTLIPGLVRRQVLSACRSSPTHDDPSFLVCQNVTTTMPTSSNQYTLDHYL